jgi:hypothetical protein
MDPYSVELLDPKPFWNTNWEPDSGVQSTLLLKKYQSKHLKFLDFILKKEHLSREPRK